MPTGNAGATHAWAEVYLPIAGWIAFDPTHHRIADTFTFGVYGLLLFAGSSALAVPRCWSADALPHLATRETQMEIITEQIGDVIAIASLPEA